MRDPIKDSTRPEDWAMRAAEVIDAVEHDWRMAGAYDKVNACEYLKSVLLAESAKSAIISKHAPDDVCELALCESERLCLRADQTYRFVVMPNCKRCAEMHENSKLPTEQNTQQSIASSTDRQPITQAPEKTGETPRTDAHWVMCAAEEIWNNPYVESQIYPRAIAKIITKHIPATQRTNAESFIAPNLDGGTGVEVVGASFARTLERELNEAKQLEFKRGYFLAVANIVQTHDAQVIATDVLRAYGHVDLVGIDEYDKETLRPLIAELNRQKSLNEGGAEYGGK